MARKSKYNPQYHIPWIKGLLRRGLTIAEVAKDLEVATSTLNKWIAENEDLQEAVDKGRNYADITVEESLYKKAIGYKVTKKRTIISAGGNSGEQKPARVEISEEDVPPDTTACIFWLKNRNPELWRDRQEVALSDNEWVKALEEAVKDDK